MDNKSYIYKAHWSPITIETVWGDQIRNLNPIIQKNKFNILWKIDRHSKRVDPTFFRNIYIDMLKNTTFNIFYQLFQHLKRINTTLYLSKLRSTFSFSKWTAADHSVRAACATVNPGPRNHWTSKATSSISFPLTSTHETRGRLDGRLR